ncbi:hypothetical protein BP6252_08038 [Coleophoma cylindrospora]|uniref:Uncharacterized protein n=1 Tax=Coleophoma cylindrospora TaxID=1849047 RepID=A0A3D8RBT1_9HELO|nr:hypothetical protein BP6252_08038 [Coleophoma cylindrospora]
MKWFKRKKAKKALQQAQRQDEYAPTRTLAPYQTPQRSSASYWEKLPPKVVERIFSFVCPHTQDESYESCEQSALEDACMLCDLRDLSHCAQVSRKWRKLAANVMYHSIRIDVVHYCEREELLADKRRRRSKFNRNAEPENTAQARLQLLCRTVRDDASEYALLVKYLKVPYMTRETCKADLARTVAVLPHLRYVDLPEGFFTDDTNSNTLKLELQASCPDIRKMTYISGSEPSLELLGDGLWRNLEVLEFTKLNMDPSVLRQVLGSLHCLRALKVTNMKTFDDDLLQHNDYLAPFPALEELYFQDTPNLTADGLAGYLFRSDVQSMLKNLHLSNTGVHPSTLQTILATAPNLDHLSIIEAVTSSFPTASGIPPLSSNSLRTLHYEITSASSASTFAKTTTSYYAYLTSSLLQNGLPNLVSLYVRDPDFPESLIDLAPPVPAFASDVDGYPMSPPKTPFSQQNRPVSTFSSKNPFAAHANAPSPRNLGLKQPLEVYSKGLDEMEWNFSKVQPAAVPGRRGSMTSARPISSYGLGDTMGKQWANEARKSVIVGNGFGGFLAIPADGPRPRSSAGEKKSQRNSAYDMWR